jgi:hypothetical protein
MATHLNGMRKSVLGLVFLLLVTPMHSALALAITNSTLSISGVSISLIPPSAGTNTVDPWTAEASAVAHNSLGQADGQFDSSSGAALANAAVTFATGQGQANAISMTANAASAVNLPGFNNEAGSTGLGSLFTTFMITGGTGDVLVAFSMHLDALQHGFADQVGSFRSELVASLELDGDVVLFRDSILSGGPNFPDTVTTVATTLSDTRTLTFDTTYFVFIQADSESNAFNVPEPSGLALILGGVALLAGYRCGTRRVAT